MPSHLKALVRARMEKTGESYEQALRRVRAQEARERVAAPPEEGYLLSPERVAVVADTAYMVAAVRAEEASFPAADRLFEDRYAAIFVASGAAGEAMQSILDLPCMREGMRMRTRFIDDAVREGLAAGLSQVVLLGAGFDTRGLRLPEIAAGDVSVYEVDTPFQIARKQAMLRGARVEVPPHLAFVACDFHAADMAEQLAAGLEDQGFRTGEGALFVLEGVIGYVDSAAIDRTFRFVVERGGPKSRLVFTFSDAASDPESGASRVARAGFSSFSETDGTAMWRRYLPGEPHANAYAMKIGTAIV